MSDVMVNPKKPKDLALKQWESEDRLITIQVILLFQIQMITSAACERPGELTVLT